MFDSLSQTLDKNLDVLETTIKTYDAFPSDFPDKLDMITKMSYQ